jgi:hypothetical protein
MVWLGLGIRSVDGIVGGEEDAEVKLLLLLSVEMETTAGGFEEGGGWQRHRAQHKMARRANSISVIGLF